MKKSKIKEKVRPSITFNIILKNIFNLKKLPKAREQKKVKYTFFLDVKKGYHLQKVGLRIYSNVAFKINHLSIENCPYAFNSVTSTTIG
jgi:hypothetical protein